MIPPGWEDIVLFVGAITTGILSGAAAWKSQKAEKHTRPNGTNRSLTSLYEQIDHKLDRIEGRMDNVIEWQGRHEADHSRRDSSELPVPDHPAWSPRTADE